MKTHGVWIGCEGSREDIRAKEDIVDWRGHGKIESTGDFRDIRDTGKDIREAREIIGR